MKFVLGVFVIHDHTPVDYSSKSILFNSFGYSLRNLKESHILVFPTNIGVIIKALLI